MKDDVAIGRLIMFGLATALPVTEFCELAHGAKLNPHAHHEESVRPNFGQGMVISASSASYAITITGSSFTPKGY